jgi:hypothetical protein
VGTAVRAKPHGIRAVVGLALALTAVSLVACEAQGDPSASPGDPRASPGDPGAWQDADLFAVVTGDNIDALVGINVGSRIVTRLADIEQNEARPHPNGGVVSVPPVSVVLSDATGSKPIVWTQASGFDTVVVRELDATTLEVRGVGARRRGVLPFLYEGELAWASAPGDGDPRLISADGTFEVELPAVPRFVVAGPGAGRITAVVDRGNRDERIVIVDVAENTVTELPSERLHFGGIWADDKMLMASVYSRIEPTIQDPENGEPDNRVLTWSIDPADPSIAGLAAGPPLTTTEAYPELVAGGDDLIIAATGVFDDPSVEALELGSTDPARKLDLVPAERITAMSISGTTLVVLQERHVTFIDLSSGNSTTVEVGGVTETTWVVR